MATISGYDSYSIGVLFSSLNSGGNQSLFSMGSAGADLLGINYSDYASIRSGSYHKLLSAYYSKDGNADEVKKAFSRKNSTSTSKGDTKTLAKIEDAAGSLKDSADALLANGKKSVFEKVTTTGEDGVKTTDYDTDKIYKAVSQFVKDYNNLLDQASESGTTNILRAARTMTNYSKVNERMLGSVGISIGSDNKLTVDEKTFKEADMKKVQSLFQNRGAYGYQVSKQAALMDSYAKSEASKANTYGKNAVYTYNYNTGQLYNSAI